jgi:hypothetical protein
MRADAQPDPNRLDWGHQPTLEKSLGLVAPRTPEIISRFYADLFERIPGVRRMFPADMTTQRERLPARVMIGIVVERTEDDAVHRLDALAGVVRAELAAAGLPVVPDDHPMGTAGARVLVDKPDLRGVLVYWHSHSLLMEAGQAAWADDPMREGAETAAFRELIEGVSEAMSDAMRRILTLAGLEVVGTDNDYAPDELLVVRRVTVSPWRARHDATFTQRYESMQAAWNRHHQEQRDEHGTS